MATEIIRIGDIRKTQHCVRGIKRWFEAQNLDFRDFMDNGIEADVLLATGDGLAVRVVEAVRERRSTNG